MTESEKSSVEKFVARAFDEMRRRAADELYGDAPPFRSEQLVEKTVWGETIHPPAFEMTPDKPPCPRCGFCDWGDD